MEIGGEREGYVGVCVSSLYVSCSCWSEEKKNQEGERCGREDYTRGSKKKDWRDESEEFFFPRLFSGGTVHVSILLARSFLQRQ